MTWDLVIKLVEKHRDDYTVKWIAALSIKLAATHVILDEVYKKIQGFSSRDNNSYILGRIAEYNVVITGLLARVLGKTSIITITSYIFNVFL
jgi:hypothetical protein